MNGRDRDAQTIRAVRGLLLMVLLSLLTAFAMAGVAKIVAPTYDAEQLALVVGWSVGTLSAVLLMWQWRRRSAL